MTQVCSGTVDGMDKRKQNGRDAVVSEEDIRTFRKLCRKHYGISLSESEAHGQARRLLNLVRSVFKPGDPSRGNSRDGRQ